MFKCAFPTLGPLASKYWKMGYYFVCGYQGESAMDELEMS